jgi:lipoate-protein ligase A
MDIERPRREIAHVTERIDGAGPVDTGISHVIAKQVGSGLRGETLRVHRTSEVVAFGRQDTITAGYRAAVRQAADRGYLSVERMAGGRAALFHRGTLAFAWAIPALEPRAGVHARFEELAAIMASAFRALGVDARVGEVSGEYCPGAYSVNIAGRLKVMGVGQRLVRGAAHVGGVVVVSGTDELRSTLVPVYAALGLDWDPATAGSLEDTIPDVSLDEVERSILDEFSKRVVLAPTTLDDELVEAGRRLAPTHTSAP